MDCVFCPKTSRQNEFMTVETFCKILDKIQYHTNQIYLHVLGEPLLHPQLGLLLQHCDRTGMRVNITTNGTLIKKVSEILLKSSALNRVNFSLHSFNQQVFSNYSKDNYLKDIADFTVKALETEKIAIYYRFWDQTKSELQDENKQMINKLSELIGTEIPDIDSLKPQGATMIKRPLFISKEEVFDWPSLDMENSIENAKCLGIKEQLAILVDGTVVPCCLDNNACIQLGNIKENSLQDIIENPRAKAIREGFSKGVAVEELCKRCTYKKRFIKNSSIRNLN
jgi:radical SAM protein with 4Fe4S-binding SPASM domain